MAYRSLAGHEMIIQALSYCLKRASWLIVLAIIGFISESYAVQPQPTDWQMGAGSPCTITTGFTSSTQACASRDQVLNGAEFINLSSNGFASGNNCRRTGQFIIQGCNNGRAFRPLAPVPNSTCTSSGCTCNAGFTDTGTSCVQSACPEGSMRKTVGTDTQCYPILTCPNEFHIFDPDSDTTKCTFQGCDLSLYTYAVTSSTDSTPACKPRKVCASDAVHTSSPNLSEPASCLCPSPKVHDDLAIACVNPAPPSEPVNTDNTSNGGGTTPPNGSNTNPPLGGSGSSNPNLPSGTASTPATNTGSQGTTQANGSNPLPNGGGGVLPTDQVFDSSDPRQNNVQFDNIPLGGSVGTVNIGGDFNIQSFGGAGSCPVMPSFSVAGRTFSFDMNPICDFARAMKYIVLLVASIAAAFIVTGRSQND